MPLSRTESRAKVETLVTAFQRHRDHYFSGDYGEANLRVEFLDPFFVALGWDVHNERHRIGDDCEVVVEDRTRVRGHRRRPDYGFRIDRELKFFVEAKRPSKSIDDPEAAFQIKTSAWAGGAPLGLLTNFAHLRGFDGLVEPTKDAPQAGVLPDMDFEAERYLDSFDLIFDTLSRDAVAEGNLERFLERERRSRRGARRKEVLRPMDDAFLQTLERWREELASELALRNDFASGEAVAEATQRILDRIVFLRVCEDRGIEPKERLRETVAEVERDRRRSLYPALVKLFRQLAPTYNGTLFAPHASEGLRIEREEVLERIITGLYEPAPYRFDFVRPDFLGSVYERFLGSTIRLTSGGRAKVEEKPEVRHAGGVYYTPRYVVDAIVERTLGPLVEGKSPDEMLRLRVLDPACGSGSFLLAAFQYLVEKHEAWYTRATRLTKKDKEQFVLRNGIPFLTLRRKQEILTRCIFGVDLDGQAVEVAQMSLYLQLLAGERDDTLGAQLDLRATYLPTLVANIRRGNSLLAPQDLEAQRELTEGPDLHAFDWRSPQEGFGRLFDEGGFDAIIGNPPYVRIQELSKWAPREARLYREKFAAARTGNYDVYVLFIEQAMKLAKPDGRIGFILPHKFFQAQYGRGIRQLLAEKRAVAEVVDFGHAQVFEGATTYTCLLFLRPGGVDEVLVRRVEASDDLAGELRRALTSAAATMPAGTLDAVTWDFRTGGGEIAARLLEMKPTLGEVCTRIFQGLVTGADDVFYLVDRGGRLFSRAVDSEVDLEPDLLHPLLKGSVHVRRYELEPTPLRALFPYERTDGGVGLLSKPSFQVEYPKSWAYLLECRKLLEGRERGKWRTPNWYAYGRSQALDLVGRAKLLTPSLIREASFAVDDRGDHFFAGSGGGGGGGYGLLPRDGVSRWYLAALLNSHLLDWLQSKISSPFRGGFRAASRQFIERLPIRVLDLSQPAEKAEHDALVSLARRMTELKGRRRSANPEPDLDAAIEATDREIDDRVYRLYGITAEERRRIEAELEPSRAPAALTGAEVDAALERLRARFGTWEGPPLTYEDIRQMRREAWEGYVEPEEGDER